MSGTSLSSMKHFSSMAVRLNNLAVLSHTMHKCGEACELYRRAYQVMRESLCVTTGGNCYSEGSPLGTHQETTIPGNHYTAEASALSPRMNNRLVSVGLETDAARFRASAIHSSPAPIMARTENTRSDELIIIILHNMGLLNYEKGSLEASLALLTTASVLINRSCSLKQTAHFQTWVSVHFLLGVISSRQGQNGSAVQWFLTAAQPPFIGFEGDLSICRRMLFRVGHELRRCGYNEVANQAFHNIFILSSVSVDEKRDISSFSKKIGDAAAAAA